MKNYKSLEAHNFFRSGWVETIHFHRIDNRIMLLKANVKPSQRLGESPHSPWIAVDDTGSVLAGHCDCMAG